jgi:hypothetical protein
MRSRLRDLARDIENVSRDHPCWSQAHVVVLNCTSHLCAMARIEEVNQALKGRSLDDISKATS